MRLGGHGGHRCVVDDTRLEGEQQGEAAMRGPGWLAFCFWRANHCLMIFMTMLSLLLPARCRAAGAGPHRPRLMIEARSRSAARREAAFQRDNE
jgi:hypothetical protein